MIPLSSAGRALPDPAARLIAHFKMERIPQEGAWFSPACQSDEMLGTGPAAARYAGPRRLYNSIHAVLTHDDFSGLHRLATDELWHFYDGRPVELLLLFPDGHGERVVLGRDIAAGERPQLQVPRGVWQGGRPLGGAEAWSLIGNSMAPGFDYADFEIGYREELQAQFPAFVRQIEDLTRSEHLRRPSG